MKPRKRPWLRSACRSHSQNRPTHPAPGSICPCRQVPRCTLSWGQLAQLARSSGTSTASSSICKVRGRQQSRQCNQHRPPNRPQNRRQKPHLSHRLNPTKKLWVSHLDSHRRDRKLRLSPPKIQTKHKERNKKQKPPQRRSSQLQNSKNLRVNLKRQRQRHKIKPTEPRVLRKIIVKNLYNNQRVRDR